ncbi:CLUMA_CG010431, isoform A [Clunio marinus]|uniref:CLUMA_CG010431, isoform A n=1 Tax=Clunio marinus TaxID=568069 RepID=A0A1J1IEQ6_9DIPT|nr:CLUMA_CG010431, isoform A [Clunio marinus]
MDSMETESVCSNSSSDINIPKDYSLSSTDMNMKSNSVETNNNTISKSMKLNFGVERLLSKCDRQIEKEDPIDDMIMNKNLINKNIYSPNVHDNEVLLNLSANNINEPEIGNHQLEINLLHQQLTHINNGLANQNFVLKPFPIRFGRNHNGRVNFIQSSINFIITN